MRPPRKTGEVRKLACLWRLADKIEQLMDNETTKPENLEIWLRLKARTRYQDRETGKDSLTGSRPGIEKFYKAKTYGWSFNSRATYSNSSASIAKLAK